MTDLRRSCLLIVVAATLLHPAAPQQRRFRPQFRVAFEWNLVDYRWPSSEDKIRAVRNSQYIPENNVIAGIEYYNNRLFLTMPRWRNGVPVTLAWVPAPNISAQTAPLLNPFPNWELNRLGDCRALQNVQSVEVDLNGVLWVIDGGRTATMEPNPDATCPPRLVLFDLNNNDFVLREYVFPNEVALHDGSFLNDIVIDDFNGRFAYITDNSNIDPGIIVYSLANNTSWKIRDARSMHAEPEAVQFAINGTLINAPINLDSIALAPASQGPTRDLFYAPLSSFHLYSISTTILRNPDLATQPNIANHIKDLGLKSSPSDGMIMDEYGTLYFGLLAESAVGFWNTTLPIESQRLLARDTVYLQWPDSFAIDNNGNLYVTTNRLQNFLSHNIRAVEPNYRVLVAHIGARSYLFGNNNFDHYSVHDDPFYAGNNNNLGPGGRSLYSSNYPSSSTYGPSYYQSNYPYPTSSPSVSIYPKSQSYDPILSTSTVSSFHGYYNSSSVCQVSIVLLLLSIFVINRFNFL